MKLTDMKLLYGLIGVVLLIVFLAPIVFKLRGEFALVVIALIGVAMAIADMAQGVRDLREKNRED